MLAEYMQEERRGFT